MKITTAVITSMHDARVNHGAADFADNVGVFFLLVGQPFQAGVQRTGGLAGGYQVDKDLVEDRRVFGQARR